MTRDCQPREFALSYLYVVGLIVDCAIEGHFAVAVAMHIAKSYVAGVCNGDRMGERLVAAYDAIHVSADPEVIPSHYSPAREDCPTHLWLSSEK